VIRVVRAWEHQIRDGREEPGIARRDERPRPQDGVELLELAQSDRRADVVDPVVEAQPCVLEPAARVGPALVAEAAQEA